MGAAAAHIMRFAGLAGQATSNSSKRFSYIACTNGSAKIATNATTVATTICGSMGTSCDWWDSFDVSELSVPALGAPAKAIVTAPRASHADVSDELEDFLN